MKKRIVLLLLLSLVVFYFLGDSPESPQIEFSLSKSFPQSVYDVEQYVQDQESQFNIRPNNQSRVIWSNPDSISKTEYALVYLHGFSASPGEGDPLHEYIAKKHGMNLIVPRLHAHGMNGEELLLDFSPNAYMNSAYEAIKLGELMGNKVIVMSCSTGGTASLYTLANSDVKVHAQIMYSPNIDLADSKAWLLTKPWGLQLARLVKGSDYNIWDVPESAKPYWYGKYRLEGVIELKNMLNHTMTNETFAKIKCPTFVGYYYKNDDEQDKVVSVAAIKEMADNLGTTKDEVITVAFENVGRHALQSEHFSEDIESVKTQTDKFLQDQLGI